MLAAASDRMQTHLHQNACENSFPDSQSVHVLPELFADSIPKPKGMFHQLSIRASECQGIHKSVVLVGLLWRLLEVHNVKGPPSIGKVFLNYGPGKLQLSEDLWLDMVVKSSANLIICLLELMHLVCILFFSKFLI